MLLTKQMNLQPLKMTDVKDEPMAEASTPATKAFSLNLPGTPKPSDTAVSSPGFSLNTSSPAATDTTLAVVPTTDMTIVTDTIDALPKSTITTTSKSGTVMNNVITQYGNVRAFGADVTAETTGTHYVILATELLPGAVASDIDTGRLMHDLFEALCATPSGAAALRGTDMADTIARKSGLEHMFDSVDAAYNNQQFTTLGGQRIPVVTLGQLGEITDFDNKLTTTLSFIYRHGTMAKQSIVANNQPMHFLPKDRFLELCKTISIADEDGIVPVQLSLPGHVNMYTSRPDEPDLPIEVWKLKTAPEYLSYGVNVVNIAEAMFIQTGGQQCTSIIVHQRVKFDSGKKGNAPVYLTNTRTGDFTIKTIPNVPTSEYPSGYYSKGIGDLHLTNDEAQPDGKDRRIVLWDGEIKAWVKIPAIIKWCDAQGNPTTLENHTFVFKPADWEAINRHGVNIKFCRFCGGCWGYHFAICVEATAAWDSWRSDIGEQCKIAEESKEDKKRARAASTTGALYLCQNRV